MVRGRGRLTKIKDFERAGFRKVILMHPSSRTAFGFAEHATRGSGDSFSEFRTGMDHLAFSVADRTALEAWKTRFEEFGVGHSEITPSAMGDVIISRDPDNVQLEVYAPSAAT